MTDIFHEIEEDLRRERLRRLWDRFGGLIIALVVLIVVGAAGWSGYTYWQNQRAEEAGNAFLQASVLMEEGKYAEAEAAFNTLAQEAPAGYRTIARLRAANAAAAQNPAAGIKALDALATDTRVDSLVRDMATLRAALLMVDTASLADVRSRVEGLINNPSAPVRNSAREVLALAQLRAGESTEAHKTATAITEDAEATPGLRSRAELIRRITTTAEPAVPASEVPAQQGNAGGVNTEPGNTPVAPQVPPAPETSSAPAPAPAAPEASTPEATPPAAPGSGAASQ